MKLPINTAGINFIAAGSAEVVVDFETKAAKLDDGGQPIYALQVVALSEGGAEVISVKVTGEPKGITQGTSLKLLGLTAQPWAMGDRSGVSFDRTKATRTPTVLRVRDTPAGYKLQALLPAGTSVSDLDNAAEVTAAAMGVADIRVTRDPRRASLVTVAIIGRDALAGPPLTSSLADADRWSLWQPIPVGVDEDGGAVAVSLPEHNVLIGGEPGAGKSGALSLLIAAAALDPTVTLWLFDGKRVELAVWESCAARLVGPDLSEAVEVLDDLREEMDTRYAQLLAWKRRKVAPDDGLGLHVVVIDELALYLAGGEKKTRDRLAESLRDLIARGRAAGMIVLAATQRPSSDIVPTSVRDLFGFRWAMRCATRDASDTILGAGWATEGYSAAEIDPAYRGVGYLLHEGGVPIRMRTAYLDDTDLALLASRAAWGRGA